MPSHNILHYYGTTTEPMGMSDMAFVDVTAQPSHSWNQCLRQLQADLGVQSSIYLFTREAKRKQIVRNNLTWVFNPLDLRVLPTKDRLGHVLQLPDFQSSISFWRELQQELPSLFVFYGHTPNFFSRVLAHSLVCRGVPYIVVLHSRVTSLLQNRDRRQLLRTWAGSVLAKFHSCVSAWIFDHASAIVVLTESDRLMLAEAYHVDRARVFVIPSGIGKEWFYPPVTKQLLSDPRLCFVGRLEDAKGFLEALACFAQVKEHFPEAVLEVAGIYTSCDYQDRVDHYLRSKGLEGSVIFHGWMDPQHLGDLYRRCHLLLFPSKREGLPRAVLEAMACGTPAVVLSGTGGHSELILDAINGVVTSSDQMIERTIDILSDESRLRMMSDRAILFTSENFSFEQMYVDVKALYSLWLRL